ncbi:ABC transporter permease [Rubrobacter taiwanensis]|jgi:ABC-2 type transport system permease protein|uniref:Transport permease protein n=1 Tax=Rubrobacter taiwanensis TaxID=185139 RepID=A0A4R1B4L0_9ACTN|nr:ABC transporter permease [Rubrobacter taiwanensis]TCJ13044.1 ABC transporter permease [Rubrobacter taiwanensis]
MTLFDRPFRTLLSREILRFTRVWMQTIVPSLLTSLLYVIVFGLALGSRIREVNGVPYLEFILPGIAMMTLITGAYMNSSWSVFDAKRERYIDEVLISPMSDFQITLAYTLGGTLRGIIVGAGVLVLGAPFAGVEVAHPLLLLFAGLCVSFTFAALGVLVGVLATRIEHISFLMNVILQPLTFLGGVFYSVEMLPEALRVGTLFNPIFHMVDATRYATLQVSDLVPYPTFAAVFFLALAAFGAAWWVVSRSKRLRY